MAHVFDGIRVLDLSQGMAGPMAGMLFADNGAEVIKVEPPQGDWARKMPGFLMWNRGKSGVVLDLHSLDGRAKLHDLVRECDVVIETFRPGKAHEFGIDYDQARAMNPDLIYASISGFGDASAFEHLPGYEGIVTAKSGRMLGLDPLSGRAIPESEDRPIYVASWTASYGAALLCLEGVTAALYSLAKDGRGQHVETSLFDGHSATTMRLEFKRDDDDAVATSSRATDLVHQGVCLTFMTAECKDGRFIQMCARQDSHFRNWLTAVGLESLLEVDKFAKAPMGFQSLEDIAEMDALLREAMLTKTQSEWMEIFTTRLDVGADPFLTPREFIAHPQMVLNDRVVSLEDDRHGTVTQLGALVQFAETPSTIRRSAPALNEHGKNVRFVSTRPTAPLANASATVGEKRPAFDGLTVLEVAYFIAGPVGPTLIGELGARVIKVEPLQGDPYRRTGVQFVHIVNGKESLALDMKTREGKEIFQRLAGQADALVHNFRPGVPERLGMGYTELHHLNPQLVYVYAGSYGSKGPESHRPAFHSTPNALCGGGILQAGLGNRPVDDSYPDPCAGIAVAGALAMGLYARQRYGLGQYLETTMLTSSGYVHSNDLVFYDGVPDRLIPDGSQFGLSALYRLYRGADGWIFLSVERDRQWLALLDYIGQSGLATDPRFVSAESRITNDQALADILVAAFADKPVNDTESELLAVGVPVAVADGRSLEDFFADQGLLRSDAHPSFGSYWALPPRVRLSVSGNKLGHASRLGEHTDNILAELGYSAAERDRLEFENVIVR